MKVDIFNGIWDIQFIHLEGTNEFFARVQTLCKDYQEIDEEIVVEISTYEKEGSIEDIQKIRIFDEEIDSWIKERTKHMKFKWASITNSFADEKRKRINFRVLNLKYEKE